MPPRNSAVTHPKPAPLPRLIRAGDDPWPYYQGSIHEQHRDWHAKELRRKRVRPHVHRLSRDPMRRSDQIFWLVRGVNPFDPDRMLRLAVTHKSKDARWLLLHHLSTYRMLSGRHVAALKRFLGRGFGMVQPIALTAIADLEGPRQEPLYIRLLHSPEFRDKHSVLDAISRHGTVRSVPAVSAYVKKAVSRKRRASGEETDLFLALRFLSAHIDESDQVEPAFAAVVRRWRNLAPEEAQRIHAAVRWIGLRTPRPQPQDEPQIARVILKSNLGSRRLLRTKPPSRRRRARRA